MEQKELTTELLRHQLGSINLSDIEDKQSSEQERRDYCAAIAAVFPRLEKDLKKFLHAQLIYSSTQADTWEKVIFGRGSFNGIDLLFDYWKQAHNEHSERIKDINTPLEANSPIPQINE